MSHTESHYSNITVVQRVTPALRVARTQLLPRTALITLIYTDQSSSSSLIQVICVDRWLRFFAKIPNA